MNGKVQEILRLLKMFDYPKGQVSPNEVNNFAWRMGITNLTSEEVVEISNTY